MGENIRYKGSPTKGLSYIGVAKRPLIPVKKGHGYMGVLMQTTDREMIQCHGCGKWMKKISSLHTKKCLNITTKEYKATFGLTASRGLVSDQTSRRLAANAIKAQANIERFAKASRAGKFRGARGMGRNTGHRLSFFNDRGTCPLQLEHRLINFVKENKYIPTGSNRGKNLYQVLRKRYKSYGDALEAHGLPNFTRKGTTMVFRFKDGTTYAFNYNQVYDTNELYALMIKKCPVLQ